MDTTEACWLIAGRSRPAFAAFCLIAEINRRFVLQAEAKLETAYQLTAHAEADSSSPEGAIDTLRQ
jgi:hypothetical protein